MQERRNSIANALELRLSCTNPSIWKWPNFLTFLLLFDSICDEGNFYLLEGNMNSVISLSIQWQHFSKMSQWAPWCAWQNDCKLSSACCYIYFASPLSSWGPSTFHIQHSDETSSQQTTASQGKWMVSGNAFSLSFFFFSLPGSGKPERPGKITFFWKVIESHGTFVRFLWEPCISFILTTDLSIYCQDAIQIYKPHLCIAWAAALFLGSAHW